MAITRAEFLVRFPEFSDILVTKVDMILEDVDEELDGGQAFKNPDRAVAYLAAHYLAFLRLGKNGAAGAIVGETKTTKEKSVSITYAGPSNAKNADFLRQTAYGQIFLSMSGGAVDVIAAIVA